MDTPQGFSKAWIVIAIALIAAAGVCAWLLYQKPATSTPAVGGLSDAQQKAAGSIQSDSQASGRPTLSGKASGVESVSVIVRNTAEGCPIGDFYVNNAVPVVDGAWSVQASGPGGEPLPPCSTYEVLVQVIAPTETKVLDHQTLVVQ